MTHLAAERQGEITDAGGDEKGNWLIPEKIGNDRRFSHSEWVTDAKYPKQLKNSDPRSPFSVKSCEYKTILMRNVDENMLYESILQI